jgi:filamentous hemagglutinin family protein
MALNDVRGSNYSQIKGSIQAYAGNSVIFLMSNLDGLIYTTGTTTGCCPV